MSSDTLTLYVSPAGHDGWSGTLPAPAPDGSDGPLATPAGARDALRRLRTAGRLAADRPVTVEIAAGVYELAETLLFTPEDGGTAEAPVRYVAAEGAAPVLSGGRRITDWRETQHTGLRCWTADLPEVAAGQWNFTRLYVNDAPRERPRLPRSGFHRFTGLAGFADSGSRWCQGPDRAEFAPGDIRAWHNWQDVELITYQLWFDTHHRFKTIDEAARTVHFHAHSLGSLRDERGEFARYFVENVFEALDSPGQWYLDRPAGRLYYLPLPDETLATTTVVAPRLVELLRLQGEGGRRVAHLQFENLAFAHQHWELPLDCPGYIQAAWGVPGAIILAGAERCILYGCTVAHVNGYGVELLAGSTGNTVAACTVHDAGGGGIKIGHEQIRPHEAAVGTALQGEVPVMAATVADCTIRDCGHVFPSAIGIWVGNSGWNRLVHNRIFRCNYTGISCGWTWGYAPTRTICNRIEHNHIHHINHREILSDNGGIYTLGQQPGTTLRGNVIHDISCYGYGAWGIYPDEGSSEMRVEQNLVCGTKKAAYSVHYGRDNLVQDNIFALSQADHICLGKREGHRTNVFRRNLVVTAGGSVRGGVWDTAQQTAVDNLYWALDGTPFTFNRVPLAALQKQGQNRGAVVADPLFTDAAGGDFSLRPDSPAARTGFKPFDWRAAGPRLGRRRPCTFAEYAQACPLPPLDVPVIRTRIELLTPADDVQRTGRAEFAVTLANVGRAPGKGALRLSAGPRGAVGRPGVTRLVFDLASGAEQTARVPVTVRRGAGTFWLDTAPVGSAPAVPARCLSLGSEALRWPVPRVTGADEPATAAAALARVPARAFRLGERVVAEVKLGATATGLIVAGRLHEPAPRPHLAEPWRGSALELLTILPAAPDAPVDEAPPKRQLFLVPRADGRGIDGLRLDTARNRAEPEPAVRAAAEPVPGGVAFAACLPWRLFGCEQPPAEFPFQVIVDVVDAASGDVTQLLAFEPLAAGWQRLEGRLILGAAAAE